MSDGCSGLATAPCAEQVSTAVDRDPALHRHGQVPMSATPFRDGSDTPSQAGERRPHMDREAAPPATCADVGEAQEIEGVRLRLAPTLHALGRVAAKLDQACLLRVEL